MFSREPPSFPRSTWQQGLLWYASNGGSVTPDDIQHPPRKVQILTCPLQTENVPGHLPDEDGWHCSPMPQSIGHTWWCVHLRKGRQRPWCKHHQLVQRGPKRRTHVQQQEVHHKARVRNILWQSVLGRRILPRSREDPRNLWDDTTQTKKELQSFLGVVNYLQTFVPHLSSNTEPLCALLKKENCFTWDENTNTCFQKIKSQLQKALLRPLRYYDWTKPVTLQCDASLKGLGACIIQDGQPIAFASKSLMDTETRYTNIERELLAIVYGCEKFHTYLYGRTFIVETDHKPLKMISLKNLTAAPARLQRMLLHLQQYDLVITYWPGREMLLADALSHLPSRTNTEIKLDLRVDAILIYAFSQRCLSLTKIAAEMQWDPILSMVDRLTLNGWPDRQGCVPRAARLYWSFWEELSINSDLLTKDERVVIPLSCRDSMMADLHGSHAGINKAMDLARMCVYWPSMEADVTDYIKQCLTCIKCSNLPVEMLHPHEVPPRPWVKIGVDFFQDHLGKKHLIVADYFSKFPYMFPVASTHHFKTISHLRELFAAEGMPTIMSCLTMDLPSMEMSLGSSPVTLTSFITTLSPHFHQSNGFIESMVKKVKNSLQDDGRIPQCSGQSIASVMWHTYHGRPPVPSWDPPWTSSTRYSSFKTIQEGQYMSDLPETNWTARQAERTVRQSPPEPEICIPSKWKNKSSSSKTSKPQAPSSGWQVLWLRYSECGWSYTIQGPNGRFYRRNRAHIKPICHNGTSFQDHQVKKGEKQPKDNSFQDHQASQARSVSFNNKVSYIDNEVSYMDTWSIDVWWPRDTSNTSDASPALSLPRCHSPRAPSYSLPASFPSRESSVEPSSEDSSPKGRKRHQSEPAFIRPWDINQGLTPMDSQLS